jgi:tetratricopeptide (TPR) repeat protein
VLTALTRDAGSQDRFDIWTVNINHAAATRSLTDGFHAATDAPVKTAIAKLADAEYGSGAVDLKAGLEQAAKQFTGRAGRNQILLYLGDGESAASSAPLTEASRVELGNRLADRDVTFFAVPIGVRVNGTNLHGLATLTGGAVVRLGDESQTAAAVKLQKAFDTPVLRPERVTFGPEGVEVYPTRLPPLRADRPTLLVGKLKTPAQNLFARVEGRANGSKVTVNLTEQLPAPEVGNYFVHAMVDQWRSAPAKDAPAVLPADRTLAMASEQFRMFRDEFTVQAVWAINADKLDHAEKMFQAAAKIDPTSAEVKAGMRVLSRLRGGELDAAKVKARLGGVSKIGRALDELAQAPAAQPAPGAQPVPPPKPAPPPGTVGPTVTPVTPAERDLVQQARAAQQVLEQEYRVLVNDTIRRARRLLLTDPDTAYEDLKRQRDSVLANDQLSEPVRRRLVQDLEATMRDVQLRGAEVKRQLAGQRERVAQARQRLTETDRNAAMEEATRARINAFEELMTQARFELAQQEAQVLVQERVSRGQPVPVAAYAAYRIGQSASNLREFEELRRIRQDRYLLTMMQVEKSFIPYPDEPPVHFPPAAVWRELTGRRALVWGNTSLGPNIPASFRRMRSLLEGEEGRRVAIKNLSALTLDALLQQLSAVYADYGIKFVYRSDLFPPDFRPGDQKIRTQSDVSGLPLGDFLDVILRDMEMSWIARPEYIEIGPNTAISSLRYQEKVTRVFDVADLIIAIPQSVNPSTLYSSIQFQGQFLTIFGAANTPFTGIGLGFGALGGLGGFGGGGMGGGMGGMAGMGGGMLGAGGGMGGLAGVGGGMGGGLGGGFAGGGALGAQGGGLGARGAGFTGVQGGLGGQFGIQGTDQSRFLVQLVTQVVAKGEWDLRMIGGASSPLFTQDELDNAQAAVDPKDFNSIGFYPPARALIIRGSSRYHLSPSFKLKRGLEGMGAGGPGLPRPGKFANKPAPAGQPKKAAVANPMDPTRQRVAAVARLAGKDRTKLWNAALDEGITDPEVVVDAAQILFEMKEFGHTAELLKAGLRKGKTTGGWAQEALALALKSAQAAPAEVERASLSAIDLDPDSAKAYLRAAHAEGELGRPEVALAFCQRAAALEPNTPTPYVDALTYAEKATDVKSDVVNWASTNLLARDWPLDGIDYQTEAKRHVAKIATGFAANGRQAEAVKLQATIAQDKTRDLVIELRWQGKRSDLDLIVIEPSGARCSSVHRRTTGGGVLRCDILEQGEDKSELYAAAKAFPGTYTVIVKSALGQPIDNAARLVVTKHQGTDQQTVELHSVNLAEPKPVEVRLDAGTRTELANLPPVIADARLETRASASFFGSHGISAGAGAGTDRLTNTQSGQAVLPVVAPTVESRVPGISAGMPGLRVEAKLSADRKRMVLAANPVFAGPARDVAMPKVNVLPGSGQ